MIDFIRGKVIEKNPAFAVVEANGVGYGMHISVNTYSKLSDSAECKLYTEQVFVRDDNPKFYGFFESDERDIFRKLISVSGVGGASAMLMLSSLSSQEIIGAVNTANVVLLKSIKGIGEKTAQRIVVDLKGKLGRHEGGISHIMAPSYNKNREEALLALVALGFGRPMAEKAIEKAVKQQDMTTDNIEQLIKAALKNL
ncbi:MAG TPA: Holliday junction branch migration protein RuvA [Bacteroidia bacterium]|jgi:Holliday junction DNA helicase RuvA|nr:Holliday junction branch migration protein RuvA [Bacteroidia bacterium]